MELLFSTLIGVIIGAIVRYSLPGRNSYGAALLPAVGGAVTATVWVALVWFGFTFDGGWIWVISIVVGALASLAAALLLPGRRRTADDALLERLTKSSKATA